MEAPGRYETKEFLKNIITKGRLGQPGIKIEYSKLKM
jgi:hypothetical protein